MQKATICLKIEGRMLENNKKAEKYQYRYVIEIKYLGLNYKGWQNQPRLEKETIQGILEEKMAILMRYPIKLTAAGRTDAKVSATCQVAHFDCYTKLQEKKFLYSLNGLLKNESINVTNIKRCADDFHARFSCKKKTYKYYLLPSKIPNPFLKTYWQIIFVNNIDEFIEQLKEMASVLIGTHDFASFQDADCGAKSSVRTILDIKFEKENIHASEFIVMSISGPAFLQHQIRIIMGTIIELIKNNKSSNELKKILAAKNRTQAGITAPAAGLVLDKIEYDL